LTSPARIATPASIREAFRAGKALQAGQSRAITAAGGIPPSLYKNRWRDECGTFECQKLFNLSYKYKNAHLFQGLFFYDHFIKI